MLASPEMASDFDRSASALLGKRVIVGITYLNASGAVHHRIQLHGVVTRAIENEGIFLRVSGKDEEFSVPPEPDAFERAPRGVYTLRSTGEAVHDPDFTARWTVHTPRV
jgi:hypothetical protein